MLPHLITDDNNTTIKRTVKCHGKMTEIFEIWCFEGSEVSYSSDTCPTRESYAHREHSVDEARADILKQRRHAMIAYNILTYELIVYGGFNRLTVSWGWPYSAETCRNSKIKCDFTEILRNLKVIVRTL
jgi:hypothetical protein